MLDRRLFTAMAYPADYGYVEGTLAEDGDPLDALVLVSDPTFPGCRIRVRAIGVFHMADEKGPDEKLLCVPLGDPSFERIARHPRRRRRAARRDRALLPALQGPRAVEADRDARLGQPRRGGEDPRRRPRARLDPPQIVCGAYRRDDRPDDPEEGQEDPMMNMTQCPLRRQLMPSTISSTRYRSPPQANSPPHARNHRAGSLGRDIIP